MTIEELRTLFEKHDNEYGKFDKVEQPLLPCKDLCGLLLLHNLCGGSGYMIVNNDYNVLVLKTNPEDLAAIATEDDIITLIRCGISYGEDYLCLIV